MVEISKDDPVKIEETSDVEQSLLRGKMKERGRHMADYDGEGQVHTQPVQTQLFGKKIHHFGKPIMQQNKTKKMVVRMCQQDIFLTLTKKRNIGVSTIFLGRSKLTYFMNY